MAYYVNQSMSDGFKYLHLRRMNGAALMLLIGVLLLSGCSTGITVNHVTDDKQQAGNPWNLGMTRFKITITRQVVGCGNELKGKVEMLASPEVVLDTAQRYVLSSNGWWATSDISSSLAPSGISKGLNAASADATAAVISNTLGTISGLALTMAAGAPGKNSTPALVELCSEEVQKAVDLLYPPKESGRISLKKQLAQQTDALSRAAGIVSLLAQQTASDKSFRKLLPAALKRQSELSTVVADLQVSLDENMKKTSDTATVYWPRQATDFDTKDPFEIDDGLYKKWASSNLDRQGFKTKFLVHMAIRKDPGDGTLKKPDLPATANTKVGVPVRLAKTGLLLACVTAPCSDSLAKENIIKGEYVILQLGQMYVVPLTGGSFRAQSAMIAMDDAGLPTTVQVAEKVAGAAALSGANKDAASQLAALPAQLRAAELSKTNAQANQISADTALANAGTASEAATLTAQTALLGAKDALSIALARSGSQSETASVLAQTALWNAKADLAIAQSKLGVPLQTSALTAQTALLNAQSALAVAQANAQVSDDSSILGAQTALVSAQTARLNAEAALRKAEAAITQP